MELIFSKETSVAFYEDDKYNLMLIRMLEHDFNELYNLKGYVTLAEIMAALGMDSKLEHALIGWAKEIEQSKDYININCVRLTDGSFKLTLNCISFKTGEEL